MATRDIKSSILLSLLFFIVIKYFINEKSSFCIVKSENSQNKITEDEYMKAKKIVNNYYNENNNKNLA